MICGILRRFLESVADTAGEPLVSLFKGLLWLHDAHAPVVDFPIRLASWLTRLDLLKIALARFS